MAREVTHPQSVRRILVTPETAVATRRIQGVSTGVSTVTKDARVRVLRTMECTVLDTRKKRLKRDTVLLANDSHEGKRRIAGRSVGQSKKGAISTTLEYHFLGGEYIRVVLVVNQGASAPKLVKHLDDRTR